MLGWTCSRIKPSEGGGDREADSHSVRTLSDIYHGHLHFGESPGVDRS
jgi:hypothetical protein